MGRVGFEPTKHYVSDLQSDPFGRSGTDPTLSMILIEILEFVKYKF